MNLRRRLSGEKGFTLVEMAVGGMVASVLLAGLGSFLMGSFEAGAFTEGQSATLNDVRNVMQQIEKEVRGADSIVWCEPKKSCLQVGAQTPTGSFRTVRYTHESKELKRAVLDTVSGQWSAGSTMGARVGNTATQPVFTCEREGTLLRVTVDLNIEPTPNSDPTLNVHTSIRPRNYPKAAVCPAGTS